jgi:hypothetical protein
MNVISLFDYSGAMLRPWRDAGFTCWNVDIQHPAGVTKRDGMHFVGADLSTSWMPPFDRSSIAFIACWPPCTHLAVSGARWFKGKGLRALQESIGLFATAAEFCEWSGARYLIENPVSTISTYWRKPDHTFDPYSYTAYEPADNYSKKLVFGRVAGLSCRRRPGQICRRPMIEFTRRHQDPNAQTFAVRHLPGLLWRCFMQTRGPRNDLQGAL